MKRFLRTLVLTCIAAAMLSTAVWADFGPKPSLTVYLVNAPDERYYLDLLAPGEGRGNGLSDDELAKTDKSMRGLLLENVPEGWHACLAQGSGIPIYGKLNGDDGVHYFSYSGVPDTYRILIVTKSGQVWTSDTLHRRVLQSSVTVNWETKEVLTPAVWVGYALQFVFTLLPTLIIELLILLLFGFELKANFKGFLWVNLLTQGLIALFSSLQALTNGVSVLFTLWFVPLELVIALSEAALYRRLLRGRSPRRAFVYGLCANAVSAVAGWYLIGPLWRWVVSFC